MSAGRSTKFGSAAWMGCVATDPNIVAGTAVGVALMIGSRIRWHVWELQVPVKTVSERCGVPVEYVRDVVELMVLLGYLHDSGKVVGGRAVYTPTRPPHSQAGSTNESPTHANRSAA